MDLKTTLIFLNINSNNFLLSNSFAFFLKKSWKDTHEIRYRFLSFLAMLKRNYIIFCHVKTDAFLHFKQKDEKVLIYLPERSFNFRTETLLKFTFFFADERTLFLESNSICWKGFFSFIVSRSLRISFVWTHTHTFDVTEYN